MILDKAVSTAGAFLSSFTSGKSREDESSQVLTESDSSTESEASAPPVSLKPSESSLPTVDNSFVDGETDEVVHEPETEGEGSTSNLSAHNTGDMMEQDGDGVLAPGVGEVAEDAGAIIQNGDTAADGTAHTASGEGSPSGSDRTADHYSVLDIPDPG